MSAPSRLSRWGLRSVALFYLALLLIVPLVMIFFRTFEHGLSEPIDAVTSAEGLHAFWLTILCVGIAVPLNTIFGVITARSCSCATTSAARACSTPLIDLPFAVSPVVIGLALFLVYGRATAGSAGRSPTTASRSSSPPRGWCWRRSSSRCRSWCERSCPC